MNLSFILWMVEIAEIGIHRELLEIDGVYAQLHRIQFAVVNTT
jgi:ABC-type multidrug transport system fused ATPase/permease subunit